jgi:hypothetical protein
MDYDDIEIGNINSLYLDYFNYEPEELVENIKHWNLPIELIERLEKLT